MIKQRRSFCLVMTTPLALQFFFHNHLKALSNSFDITLVANEDCSLLLDSMRLGHIRLIVIPIKREINLYSDMQALWCLGRLMIKERFDVVWSVAPKAGLLAMLASCLARVPFRCHMFQGEVWVTRRGPMRLLLQFTDYAIAHLSNHRLVVSRSERDFLIAHKILPNANSSVLGYGSICGVDVSRFKHNSKVRNVIRNKLGVKSKEVVVIFLGRIKRDKGVLDLVEAWRSLYFKGVKFSLMIVGPDEDNLLMDIKVQANNLKEVNLYTQDLTSQPEIWLNAADILCLPSYREGFGNVIIEASSSSLPVVASRIYGITDAIKDGVTGLTFTAGDIAGLSLALKSLVEDVDLRARMGQSGCDFVHQFFEGHEVVSRYAQYFDQNV